MKTAKKFYVCKPCNKNFEVEVINVKEAQFKGVPFMPITCPNCKGPFVFEPK